MNTAPQYTTTALLGRASLRHAREEEYVEWAVHMLEQGHDTPNLCILAGLEPILNHFEVQDHFSRSLKELGIERKENDVEIKRYAIETVRHILNGSIDHKVGVSTLNSVCIAGDYPSYLMDWYSLDDAMIDIDSGHYPNGFPEAYGKDFREVVLGVAREFLNEYDDENR